jgi:hypothetical protein
MQCSEQSLSLTNGRARAWNTKGKDGVATGGVLVHVGFCDGTVALGCDDRLNVYMCVCVCMHVCTCVYMW